MGPIRGQTRPIPVSAGITPQKIAAQINAGIHNRFDIEVVNSETGEVRQRAQAQNVICNFLWTCMFRSSVGQHWFNYIFYGSGSGTPSSSDTSLFTTIGYAEPSNADDITSVDYTAGVITHRRKAVLSETVAVGSTISEIGVGAGTSSNTLCTHAMLKDSNGNNITITKTATDIINIYATVFVHYDATSLKAAGVAINWNIGYSRALSSWLIGRGRDYWFNIATLYRNTTFSAGGSSDYVSLELKGLDFSASTKTATINFNRVAAPDGNVGGIIMATAFSELECRLSGYNLTGVSIGTGDGTTKDFKSPVQRIKTATLYADGVIVQGSVDDKPLSLYAERSFQRVANGEVLYGGDMQLYSSSNAVGKSTIVYNPYYNFGIASFTSVKCTVEVSDDLTTWIAVTSSVDSAYRKYKYWRITPTVTSEARCYNFMLDTDANDIHFATAPAAGAVLTMDATYNCVPKTAANVFDFSVTIKLGEYTS